MNIIYKNSPLFIQNLIISIYNVLLYRQRYGGSYRKFKEQYKTDSILTLEALKVKQSKKYAQFLNHVRINSPYYAELYENVNNPCDISNIEQLPIQSKEMLRSNLSRIYTVGRTSSILSKTGGTTGASLEVRFTKSDVQDRFALLDNFRAQSGYSLGKRTAWFSGKELLMDRDVRNSIFWKTDFIHNVRYYSTFHIKPSYMKSYFDNLIEYRPEYMVGFPSSMLEIANYGLRNSLDFPEGIVKAIFPTAESITESIRARLEAFFHARVYDQYASSEGAPFIFECLSGKLHLELQSGVFEVLDDDNNYSNEGRLVITSFSTHGTPLVRYDIGDRIELDYFSSCDCGNNNPIVKTILGRVDDFIFSQENGKINLGNISNTLKGVNGIKKMQICQDYLDKIDVRIVVDLKVYSRKDETTFLNNWRARIGQAMELNIIVVEDIPVEKSGKYRMVKNRIRHLLN
jgi:phenylacetate-CoA ligase